MISRDAFQEVQALVEDVKSKRSYHASQVTEHTGKVAEMDRILEDLEPALLRLSAMVKPEPTQQPKLIRNSMALILRAERKPLHYRELLDRLVDSGVEVNGADPSRTVNAHLSNDERFVKAGRGYWGLSSWPKSRLILADEDDDSEQPRPTRIRSTVQQPALPRAANDIERLRDAFADYDDLEDVPF